MKGSVYSFSLSFSTTKNYYLGILQRNPLFHTNTYKNIIYNIYKNIHTLYGRNYYYYYGNVFSLRIGKNGTIALVYWQRQERYGEG